MRHLLTAAVCLTLAAPLAAQAHPDMTGTWLLDPAKSTASGAMAVASTGTYTIVQVGDSMTVDQHSNGDAGEIHMTKVWKADGKAWTNAMVYNGTALSLSSVLSWKDQVLIIHTATDYQGTPVEQDETWKLSADGKMLTVNIVTTAGGAEYANMTMVFNKK